MDKDPITGQPYPPDAIQRILHVTSKVHIYRIPPISSTKGFNAATWTQNPADLLFTSRLRVLETAIPPPSNAPPETPEKVSTTILLEDPSTGELFAAAPYTSPAVVEQALDSSRFFAIRVVGEGGMKATLGLGFEERPEAFDFGVCLQDVQKVLSLGASQASQKPGRRGVGASGKAAIPLPAKEEVKRDYSLKEGETIKINIGGKMIRNRHDDQDIKDSDSTSGSLFSIPPPPGSANPFSIPPPPGSGNSFAIPPPPGSGRRRQQEKQQQPSAAALGFDDGEFGEFQ